MIPLQRSTSFKVARSPLAEHFIVVFRGQTKARANTANVVCSQLLTSLHILQHIDGAAETQTPLLCWSEVIVSSAQSAPGGASIVTKLSQLMRLQRKFAIGPFVNATQSDVLLNYRCAHNDTGDGDRSSQGVVRESGDNSDNGHYTIDVDEGKMYNDKGESIN